MKHSFEVKLAAVNHYLAGHAGIISTAKLFQLSHTSLSHWINLFLLHGPRALDFCGWQLYERGELVDVLWGELEWSSPTDDDELPEVTGPAWIVDNVAHYGG